MAGIKEVMEALKALGDAIDVIETTYDYTPPSINEAQCPVWFPVVRSVTYEYRSEDVLFEPREYRVNVFYGKEMAGRPGDSQKAAYPLHETIVTTLRNKVTLVLDGDEGLFARCWLLSDTGIASIRYPEDSKQIYIHTQFRLRVDLTTSL